MGKSKKSRWRKRDIRDMKGWRKSRKSTKNEKEERGGETAKEKKNYMLLIIFMVLIFNSLSFPETKKQQHMYYLWQAQKNHAVVTPFFSRGLCNRARYTAEPPLPPDMEKAGDTGRNFCKDGMFS